MESAEAVAAKRRVLVDALMMCIERSRVCTVVDGPTVRGVLATASAEMWREGEFRLDPVWKLLIAQPGLTAEDVAPPLLCFKGYEKELGVQVRMPQALTAIPRGEQVRLRDTLGLQRQDFQRAIDEMREFAAAEARLRVSSRSMKAVVPAPTTGNNLRAVGPVTGDRSQSAAMRAVSPGAMGAPSQDADSQIAAAAAAAEGTLEAPDPSSPYQKAPPPADRRALALTLGVLGLVGTALGAWMALRDTAKSFPLGDVAGTLQLGDGRAAGGSMTAVITDSRWETLPPDERRKLVGQVMDTELTKGIHVMTLVDGGGNPRAIVTDTPGGRNIVLP